MKRMLFLIAVMTTCFVMASGVYADPPANDDCANADDAGTLVSGTAVQLSGTTSEATMDCSALRTTEVWVKFTVPSCMDVTIDFCSDGNTINGAPQYLYTDCPCGTGISYVESGTCSNRKPWATWDALDAGTYYYALTTTYVPGAYTINITGESCAVPANDDCSNATAIGEVTSESFTTVGSSFDGEGTCNSAPNVWFVYTPTFTGTARVSLSGYNTKFAVYDGAVCSPLSTEIGCTEDSSLEYSAVIGQQYLVEIGGIDGATGDGSLTISQVQTAPVNDDCANADDAGTLVSGVAVQLTGTTTEATMDCSSLRYPEVWIKFTVPSCMDVTIDYCSNSTTVSSAPTYLYTECPCGTGLNYEGSGSCTNRNPSTTWNALDAGTYYYAIATSNISGSYTVNITGTDCPVTPESDFVIEAPYSGTNTTCGAGNDCYSNYQGEDHIYEVTIPTTGNWDFSLCNSDTVWDSFMYLGTSICGLDLGYSADTCENEHAELAAYNLQAGTYYLTIDSPSEECGNYTLDITNLPGSCDGSYYTNGAADLNSGINDFRCDTYSYFAADDFTLTEAMTLDSLKFIYACIDQIFYFDGTGDYQIIADNEGIPGDVLYEGTGVTCTRTITGETYQGMTVYAFQFDNLGIELPAGTYFLACRPVVSGEIMNPSYWLTTGSQSGSTAYYQNTDTPTWTIAGVNADLAFCLFASPIIIDSYDYVPGDVNMLNGQWPPTVIGGDVTYLVNYFRGINSACLVGGFFCSADANGDCYVIGSDVTKMVNYFRGLTSLSNCADYEPTWLTPSECPTEAPTGWPNCGE